MSYSEVTARLQGRTLGLGMVALLAVGCSQASTEEHDRLIRLEAACKQFVAEAGWWHRDPLAEGSPELARDDLAIRQMLAACERTSTQPE